MRSLIVVAPQYCRLVTSVAGTMRFALDMFQELDAAQNRVAFVDPKYCSHDEHYLVTTLTVTTGGVEDRTVF